MDLKKYESIRPLAPEEVQTAIQHLTSLEPLRTVYESLQLEQSWDELVEVLSTCHSVEDFKRTVSYHWVKHIMRKCCSSVELTALIQELTREIYQHIDARGIIRVDYIIEADGRPTLLEVNTTPGMTPTSFIPQQVQAAGLTMQDLLTDLIQDHLS